MKNDSLLPLRIIDYRGIAVPKEPEARFEYARIEAKWIRGLSGTRKPLRYFTLSPVLRNLYDSKLGADAWQRINGESLDSLTVDSKIVFLLHGLTQNPNSLLAIAKYFRSQNILVNLIGWNDKAPVTESIEETTSRIEAICNMLDEKITKYGFGHSSGADLLRYAHNQGRIKKLERFVFAAPTTNGCEPSLITNALFKQCPFYTEFLANDQNAERITQLQKPSEKYLVIAGLNDYIVPLESSLDLEGKNLILNCGHLALSGAETRVASLIKEFLTEPKDLSGGNSS